MNVFTTQYWPARFLTDLTFLGFICLTFISVSLPGTSHSAMDDPDSVSFNRDIRPILSDKCFHCHGPSDESREAGLRFDIRDEAYQVISPGRLEDSEFIHRILDDDPDSQMPPAEINKPLTAEEIELLKKWVEQGANWAEFWAYVPPSKHPLPQLQSGAAPNHWIDQFITAQLENNGLKLSRPADKTTLLRRLYFDLVGLPPTPQQVDAFLADSSENAFEKVVDDLLNSQHFGERQAIYWLDLVRYADTVGYHGDQDHNISPYRDWVINAFNDNMPFDQFTREQLAGDLLPQSTRSQKIASGYNRLLQTSHEGGIQPKEYAAIYAADRVRNVSLVWMGATVGCAQCHDHKYDPYTATDFYSLAAFFADVDDERHFKVGTNALPTKRPPEMLILNESDQRIYEQLLANIQQTAAQLKSAEKAIANLSQPDRAPLSPTDETAGPPVPSTGNPSAEKSEIPPSADQLEWNAKREKIKKELARQKKQLADVEANGAWTMISQALTQPRTTRVLARGDWLDDTGVIVAPAIPAFMGKLEPGTTRATRLDLANWLTDASHDSGLLTARVFANRFWYLLMGQGLSKSLDDFGGQGEAPSYPRLLDNLAIEFIESNWDVKHLIRQIVTSQTYQQASLESDERRASDPYNQLFSHQSRYRLPAELVRDNALAISGLLNTDQVGGKSVKPHQPAGYYRHLNFPKRRYAADTDGRQWRRGVYTHWQRQFLHPSLKALDAPSREECTARRPQSNTPSAALVLLNDPIFIEAARVFATRVIRESESPDFNTRLAQAFRLAVSRKPEPNETKILQALYNESKIEFDDNATAAHDLISIGSSPIPADTNEAELAAWTTVTRAILNLNETMTRN